MRTPSTNETAPARSCNSGEGEDNHLAAGVTDDVTPDAPFNACCRAWYGWGVVHGIDMGREQMDNELGTIQREAARIVHRMAELDPWPVAQAKAKIRTLEAALRAKENAEPWPEEVGQ